MANREESLSPAVSNRIPAGAGGLGPHEGLNSSEGSNWLPLLDYAMKTGLSLSTLRRYIKAQKVEYKIVRGRYLLRADGALADTAPASHIELAQVPASHSHLSALQQDLERAKEEIAELKTLIAFYEERMSRGTTSRDS